MKKTLFALLTTTNLLAIPALAQENHLNVSFKPRLALNNLDVYHDDFMNNALSSGQELGWSFDFVYKRVTPSGLIYGAGIDVGRYTESISIRYDDLNDFRADGQFENVSYQKNIHSQWGYLSVGPFIGYEYNLDKNATKSIAIEFGIKYLFAFEGSDETTALMAKSAIDQRELKFGSYTWARGNTGYWYLGPILMEGAITYNFSLGHTKRQFFAGIMGTLNAFFFNAPGRDLSNNQSGNFMLGDFTTDINGRTQYGTPGGTYYEVLANKHTSIGLKLGMNLYRF